MNAVAIVSSNATLSHDGVKAENWLQAADLAMYRTKFFERQKR